MNKQGRLVGGRVVGGIEWTKTVLPDGTERQGYTWNVIGGCQQRCKWVMPNGELARCYAKDVALGVAQAAYPHGFEHHYFHPERLGEPLRVNQPARIFLDSMSDLMGHWVPEEQILQVLDVCRRAHWHTFQLLTKNAPRLLAYATAFPSNVWVGVSSPPDYMWGKPLSRTQQERMLRKTLEVLQVLARDHNLVTWASIEPLSWDVAPIIQEAPHALRWAVIGAASNGAQLFQPDPAHVQSLLDVLDVLDAQGVPVFFKGNLKWSPWREEFPKEVEA